VGNRNLKARYDSNGEALYPVLRFGIGALPERFRMGPCALVSNGWFYCAGLPPCGGLRCRRVILQYFNTSWAEIARRIPELAEAGYNALWLPPRSAGGGLSVGFDCYDRFDLGTKNQNGSITTKYGTETELLHMMDVAHRFGFRVYFDNVMAHNGGPMSSGSPGTLQANGFVPETSTSTARRRRRTRTGAGHVERRVAGAHRNPFGQDIAQESEDGLYNTSFGYSENANYREMVGCPARGPDGDLPRYRPAAGDKLRTAARLHVREQGALQDTNSNGRFDWTDTNANGQHDPARPVSRSRTRHRPQPHRPLGGRLGLRQREVRHGQRGGRGRQRMLNRSIRWFTDKASADGFRLDAVKHVPSYFFGKMDARRTATAGATAARRRSSSTYRAASATGQPRDTVFTTSRRATTC